MEGIYPPTVTLTVKEATMGKIKLIVHEYFAGKQNPEDVFAAVFLSSATVLTESRYHGIIKKPNNLRIRFASGKGQLMEQVRNEQTIYSAAVYCRLLPMMPSAIR